MSILRIVILTLIYDVFSILKVKILKKKNYYNI